MYHNPSIRVSAVVLVNERDEIALVRKHGTRYFIFPGGKPEPGETGVDAAVREVAEELGVQLAAENLHYLGDYTTDAANEADTQLLSQVYAAQLPSGVPVTAQAEIAQLIWTDPKAMHLPAGTTLAPLSATILTLQVLPMRLEQ